MIEPLDFVLSGFNLLLTVTYLSYKHTIFWQIFPKVSNYSHLFQALAGKINLFDNIFEMS